MSVVPHCLQPTISGWDISMASIESAELNSLPLMPLLQVRKPQSKIRTTTAFITTHTNTQITLQLLFNLMQYTFLQ